jgi:hypothetical protein
MQLTSISELHTEHKEWLLKLWVNNLTMSRLYVEVYNKIVTA